MKKLNNIYFHVSDDQTFVFILNIFRDSDMLKIQFCWLFWGCFLSNNSANLTQLLIKTLNYICRESEFELQLFYLSILMVEFLTNRLLEKKIHLYKYIYNSL
jgi:hypothetical protein